MQYHLTQNTSELTDCGDERGVEGVLAKSEEEACLSHSAVPYEQEFEQVIVCLRHLHSRYSLYEWQHAVSLVHGIDTKSYSRAGAGTRRVTSH